MEIKWGTMGFTYNCQDTFRNNIYPSVGLEDLFQKRKKEIEGISKELPFFYSIPCQSLLEMFLARSRILYPIL
jgi:hypothetical protein